MRNSIYAGCLTSGLSKYGSIFFLVAGIAQPLLGFANDKEMGRIWYAIGIGGVLLFLFLLEYRQLWTITRIPDNPITGRVGPSLKWLLLQKYFRLHML